MFFVVFPLGFFNTLSVVVESVAYAVFLVNLPLLSKEPMEARLKTILILGLCVFGIMLENKINKIKVKIINLEILKILKYLKL